MSQPPGGWAANGPLPPEPAPKKPQPFKSLCCPEAGTGDPPYVGGFYPPENTKTAKLTLASKWGAGPPLV